ncbi:MAG: hypothetical protein ACLFUH_11915 [Bacteroidales bacterium]
MKRKVLAITLTGLFSIGLLGIINNNPTNQEKNIQIIQASYAQEDDGGDDDDPGEPVNCIWQGDETCPFWPEEDPGNWTVYY